MSLAMSRQEREAFLAGVHVGVLSVNQEGLGPLTVPVWYAYTPGGEVSVMTAPSSRKARLIEASGRFSLCAQTEAAPYQYATVEGPVTSVSPADIEERRAMAYRYLGQEFGDLYLEATKDETNVVIRMTPQHWLTTDYNKQFG